MINSHKVTKHACTSSWLPLAHSIHHTYHQVTVMNKQQKNKGYKQLIYIYIYISHVNVTQTVPYTSPLMPMHQDPLLVSPLCVWQPFAQYHSVRLHNTRLIASLKGIVFGWHSTSQQLGILFPPTYVSSRSILIISPDSKIHGANTGSIWVWQGPGGPHVGHMNFAIRAYWITSLVMRHLYDLRWCPRNNWRILVDTSGVSFC